MKIRNLFASLALLVAASDLPVQAGYILSDDFDGYANQGAFEAVWTPIGSVAPTSATLSNAQSVSPSNSVHVPFTASNNQYRNRRSFTDSPTLAPGVKLVWSFDFYDTNSNGSPSRNYANLQDTIAPGATNQLISMGLNNNQSNLNSGGNYYMARILGYSPPTVDPDGGPNEGGTLGSGAYFKLNDFGVGLRTTGWTNLKVIISTDDGLSTDYAFYVNDQLAELVSNVGTAASIRQYDNIVIGSGLSNASTPANTGVYFDNMRFGVIPEPTSLALVALCGVGLGCLRSKR